MSTKSFIVGALLIIVLVRHGASAPPAGEKEAPDHVSPDNRMAFPADLLRPASRNLPLTFDQVFRLAKLGHNPKPWILIMYHKAPALKKELISALADSDPKKAEKAAQFLGSSADFRVIKPLLEFAQTPGRNEACVAEATESIKSILHADTGEDRSSALLRRDGETRMAYNLRLCAHFENETTEWKYTTYVQAHARRVERILQRLTPRSTDDERRLFYSTLCEFWETDDAQGAAPWLVKWAPQVAKNTGDHAMANAILKQLQRYVGPLDTPDRDEPAKVEDAIRSISAWWRQNEQKKPANWRLDRLAARGYATQNPEDIQATAAAIALAVKRGRPIERYSAETFLAQTLPDGESIYVPPILFQRPALADKDDATEGCMRDYMHALALERALHWWAIDGWAMTWNPDTARYYIVK